MQFDQENMRKLDKFTFLAMAGDIQKLHGGFLHNFIAEATRWYEMLEIDEASDGAWNEFPVEDADLIAQATPFRPAVCEVIKISVTIPFILSV